MNIIQDYLNDIWKGDFIKISILCVGKIKEKYWNDAIAEYKKRLTRYCKIEIIEVADEKTPENAPPALEEQIKQKEGKKSSLGLSNEVLGLANRKISFSDMTFPHQMMRVILLEQVYRGYKIISGEPYHK